MKVLSSWKIFGKIEVFQSKLDHHHSLCANKKLSWYYYVLTSFFNLFPLLYYHWSIPQIGKYMTYLGLGKYSSRPLVVLLNAHVNGRGPSGHHARLQVQWSEFESHWSLQYFCKLLLKRTKINKKAAGVGPFLNKTLSFIELWESFSAIVLIRAKSLSHIDIYIKQFHLSKHF